MLETVAWMILAIVVILGIVTVFVVLKRRKEGTLEETNYRVFFVTGAAMTPIGLVFVVVSYFRDYSFFTSLPILTIGIVYLAIGLANRDKWKKQ
ncbi:hypothetical protein ACFLUT_02975 [Chloroflexota bacterium]